LLWTTYCFYQNYIFRSFGESHFLIMGMQDRVGPIWEYRVRLLPARYINFEVLFTNKSKSIMFNGPKAYWKFNHSHSTWFLLQWHSKECTVHCARSFHLQEGFLVSSSDLYTWTWHMVFFFPLAHKIICYFFLKWI
jgi:hypothetical protein